MGKGRTGLLLAGLCVAGALTTESNADMGKVRGPWIYNDLPKAQAEARKTGKEEQPACKQRR